MAKCYSVHLHAVECILVSHAMEIKVCHAHGYFLPVIESVPLHGSSDREISIEEIIEDCTGFLHAV